MDGLQLAFLGGFSAHLHKSPIATFRSQKTRALLAYLSIESGRVHQREFLTDLLWSEQDPTQANSNFRQSLSRLQRAIGNKDAATPYLMVTRKTVQWNPSSDCTVDVHQLLQATEGALTQTDLADAIEHLRQAHNLYHDDLLASFFVNDAPQFDQWVAITREQLHQQYAKALDQVATRAEAANQFGEAITLTNQQLLLDPWSEIAHQRLMRSLAMSGERSAALSHFQRCKDLLHDEFKVEPSNETQHLYQHILNGTLQAPRSIPTSPINSPINVVDSKSAVNDKSTTRTEIYHHLPARLTHFVGREYEVDELSTRLRDPTMRLTTIVGPGGIGKTSLARETARLVSAERQHGSAFVSLAAIDDDSLLPRAIIDALNLSSPSDVEPSKFLLAYLEPLDLILVLDNYEQLIASENSSREPTLALSILLDILRQAPSVDILITSRVRLNLPHEWVYGLGGMNLPPTIDLGILEGRQADLSHFEQSNAVALFVHSARQVRPHFALTHQNVHAVAKICRMVEGLPLGIELAAAWTRVLSCDEIRAEIENSLAFLSTSSAPVPERHRSLHALFDSSWQKLTPKAQEVVLRLSIFRSRFDRTAATEIADASLAALAELIDHSFVTRIGAGAYQMHELMRQLAAEKLAADMDLSAQTKAIHALYFGRYLAARTEPFLATNSNQILFEIEERFGDATMAWEYLTQHKHFKEIDSALDALNRYCRTRGRVVRGAELFEQALDAHKKQAKKSRVQRLFQIRLMSRLGGLYVSLGQHQKAQPLVTDALQLGLALQAEVDAGPTLYDPNPANDASHSLEATIAYCYWCLLFMPSAVEDGARVDYLFEKGVEYYQKCELQFGVANMRNVRGVIAHNRGKLNRARELYIESHRGFDAIKNYKGLALTLHNLGKVNEELGNYEEARTYLHQGLQYSYALSDDENSAFMISSMARIGMYQGEYEAAETQAKEALAGFERIRFQQGVAFTCELLGEIMLRQDKVDEAEEYLTLGMSVCQQHSYPIEAALVATTHASVALHQFELEQAQELAQKAISFAQQGHSRSAEGPAYSILGEIAVNKEEFDEARIAFETAVEIGRDIGAPLVWLKAQAGLAELEMRLGYQDKSEQLVREVRDHQAATHQLRQRVVSIL